MNRSALIDGDYRYELGRTWSDGPVAAYIMLNPSTADASRDDFTIRRCIGLAKSIHAGGIYVVNLFALRATDPMELKRVLNPHGALNSAYILKALEHKWTIAAWGAHPMAKRSEMLHHLEGKALYCFGVSRDGSPRHPLYLPVASQLRSWHGYNSAVGTP